MTAKLFRNPAQVTFDNFDNMRDLLFNSILKNLKYFINLIPSVADFF